MSNTVKKLLQDVTRTKSSLEKLSKRLSIKAKKDAAAKKAAGKKARAAKK